MPQRMKPTTFCERCGCWKMPNSHQCKEAILTPPVHRSSLIPPPSKPSWLGTAALSIALLLLCATWSFICYQMGSNHARIETHQH